MGEKGKEIKSNKQLLNPTNLEANLALTPLSLSFMQADHESLIALLPIQSHGLMAPAEHFNFILLHIWNNLETKEKFH